MTSERLRKHKSGWRRVRKRIGSRLSDLQVLGQPFVRVSCLAWCWLMHHTTQTERRGPIFDFARDGRPCIVVFWHEDALPVMFEMIRYTRGWPGFIMLSRGRVGRLARFMLDVWGMAFVHGSDRHKGREALASLVRQVEAAPWSVFVTGDGSRGPEYEAKWGAVTLARETGLPLVAVRCWGTHHWVVRGGALRIAVPLPFGRSVVISDEPMHVPADADDAALDAVRLEMQRRLRGLTEASLAYFKSGAGAGAGAVEKYGPIVDFSTLGAAAARRKTLVPLEDAALHPRG